MSEEVIKETRLVRLRHWAHNRRGLDPNADIIVSAIDELLSWRHGMMQPIATAAKDGTAVLLYSPKHGYVEGSWDVTARGRIPQYSPQHVHRWKSPRVEFVDPHDAPTSWMPLPKPFVQKHERAAYMTDSRLKHGVCICGQRWPCPQASGTEISSKPQQ